MSSSRRSLPSQLEHNPLGPRCFLFGVRAHEWHVGLVALAAAVAIALAGAAAVAVVPVALAGTWLLLKDWHDIGPSKRDTAAWQLGIHRVPAKLRRARRGASLPAVSGWLAGAVGALNVISALTPELPGRVAVLSSLAGSHTVLVAHALALPAGLALLVISPYLVRRRSRALYAAVVLLVALGGLNLAKGLDLEEALVSWALAGLLVWGRDSFFVRHGRLTARETVRSLLPPAVTALAAGLAAFLTELWATPTLTVALAFVVALAVARIAFRPLAAPSSRPTEPERREARRLVRANGSDTLSFFKLRKDLQHLFSRDGRAFLSYRVEGGVLLCSGDPIGPDDAVPGLLIEACLFAEARGLKIAFVGAGERLREVAADAGLHAIYMGDEAMVDNTAFSLVGRPMRKVRQSVNRLSKAGYTAELCFLRDVGQRQLDELEAVSERWRRGRPERGFSMAMDSLRGEHVGDSSVVIARDAEGHIRGFLHFVPSYGSPRASLSAMPRDHDAPNGLTEFMIVRAIELFPAQGVRELSLNFAAFGRFLHAPLSRAEWLLGRLVSLANPFFQIESLYSFNAKFDPRWQPRYLLYEGMLGLARAGVATLWAEGQLPKPSLRPAARPAMLLGS